MRRILVAGVVGFVCFALGHVFSRHSADQIPLWLKDEYRLMLFAAEDIQAAALGVILLKPASPGK